jgi:hypothetical protein
MTAYVLLDEIHVEVRVPRALPPDELAAIRRTLMADQFLARLRAALRPAFAAHPALAAVRVRLAR